MTLHHTKSSVDDCGNRPRSMRFSSRKATIQQQQAAKMRRAALRLQVLKWFSYFLLFTNKIYFYTRCLRLRAHSRSATATPTLCSCTTAAATPTPTSAAPAQSCPPGTTPSAAPECPSPLCPRLHISCCSTNLVVVAGQAAVAGGGAASPPPRPRTSHKPSKPFGTR